MVAAGIGELKTRLSAYLARVRAGEEVLVTDRGRPVARLVPPHDVPSEVEEELRELERAGIVEIGSGALPPGFFDEDLSEDPDGAVRSALLDERRTGR